MKKKNDGLWVSLKSKKKKKFFFVSFSAGLEGEIEKQRVFLRCLASLLQRQEVQTVQSRSFIWTNAVYQINPLEELPGLPPVCWTTGHGEPARPLQFPVHTKERCIVNTSCGVINTEEKQMHFAVNIPPSPCYLTGTCPDIWHHVHLAYAQVICWIHKQFDVSRPILWDEDSTCMVAPAHTHIVTCAWWRWARTTPAKSILPQEWN